MTTRSRNPLGSLTYGFGGGKQRPIQDATTLEIQKELNTMLVATDTKRAIYAVALMMELLLRRDSLNREPLKTTLSDAVGTPTKFTNTNPR